jgi:hypothetical protein
MKYELLMECRAGTRHAFKTVMIIKLPNELFKLHKVCSQCKSEKFPTWNARGVIIKSPTYRHSAEYREFLNNHNPAEARVAILTSDIKKVEHGTNNPNLRLVPGRTTRGRKARSVKRARDKRHANA